MEIELKIKDETLKLQVAEDDLQEFLSKLNSKSISSSPVKELDESEWKVHPFYSYYEVHPEGLVRDCTTKAFMFFKKYRKEEHHKPQFINSNIIDSNGGKNTVALHKMVADTFVPIPWYLQNYSYVELSVGLKDGNYENIEAVKAYNLAWYVGRIRGNEPMIKVMDLENNNVLYFPNSNQINSFLKDNRLDPKKFEIQ